MWTVENRGSYDRGGLRYPSDVTDDEWAHIAPLIPPAKRGGRKRNVDVRDVVNGLMYILSTGCQWRAIPKDLPPRSTLFGYFELWDYDGTLDRIHHSLYVKCREAIGREASPTACVIDSQSVKGAEKGGPASIRRATMRVRRSKVRADPRTCDSSTRGWRCQTPEHDADHGETDEGDNGSGITLEVAGEAPVAADPGERSLHDPAFRQGHEAVRVGALNDFQLPAAGRGDGRRHPRLSLPFIPSIAETLEFCITTGYPFRHA